MIDGMTRDGGGALLFSMEMAAQQIAEHPCEKPADLMAHIIQSSSREGDLVADFFMGSGTTLKAALKLNRRVLGVELEEARFRQTEQEIKSFTNK